ncbi:hypothetical protein PENTCL1PPCAC_29133, partial [Pristionchus entomophagus]
QGSSHGLVLLEVLVVCAAITGFVDGSFPIFGIVSLTILVLLVGLTTSVLYRNKEEQPDCLLFATGALLSTTMLPLICYDVIPPFQGAVVYPCKLAAISLVPPLLVLTSKQRVKMHVLIATTLVMPSSLIAVLVNDLEREFRTAMLFPSVTFVLYKAITSCSHSFGSWNNHKMDLTWIIRGSAVALFVGTLIKAIALALDQHDSKLWLTGGTLICIGGPIFNCVIVIQRSV